jgi:hypothetical protein
MNIVNILDSEAPLRRADLAKQYFQRVAPSKIHSAEHAFV